MNILFFSEQFYIVLQLIIGVFTFPLNKVGWFGVFFFPMWFSPQTERL